MKPVELGAVSDGEAQRNGWLYASSALLALVLVVAVNATNNWVLLGADSLDIDKRYLLNLSRKVDFISWVATYAVAGGIGTINKSLWRLVTGPQLLASINIVSIILIWVL